MKDFFDVKIEPLDIFGEDSTPKKRRSCPKAVKEAHWRKYIGNKLKGKCYVCGKPITFFDFEVGHNRAFVKGGSWNINNLRPICRTCNRSMGTMTIEAFKKKYFSRFKKVKKNNKKKKKRRKSTIFEVKLPEIKLPKIEI